ncbi:MAG: segregation/condensation protein A [Gammaproteobacteria bacterium]|nr:segregation/condensation protein A [Gammaproteobacteria bacterium]MBU1722734.1 segregation/condensation protein A [Gammaproteobacteria bacterium]MBU2006091.1 segregation/condensation protein A [Gammaproteobacteria bacterium]
MAASSPPIQREIPLAIVRGEQVVTMPEDLYIPPDALEVFLEAFEGPLDLLLYLIRRQNFDICDIPIAHITEQYVAYVELMKDFKLDLAAEYLLMAAMLAEIKSRMLLPRHAEIEEEDDPRAQLMRQLQEYEQCKQAAADLDELPRLERESWVAQTAADFPKPPRPQPQVELKELLLAFHDVLKRADMFTHHQIQRENLSIRERMTYVLATLQTHRFVPFENLFRLEEGRRGVVVTLMAILELLKAHLIEVTQGDEAYAPLYVRPSGMVAEEGVDGDWA